MKRNYPSVVIGLLTACLAAMPFQRLPLASSFATVGMSRATTKNKIITTSRRTKSSFPSAVVTVPADRRCWYSFPSRSSGSVVVSIEAKQQSDDNEDIMDESQVESEVEVESDTDNASISTADSETIATTAKDNFDGEGFANYLLPYVLALVGSVLATAAMFKFVLLDY